MKTKQLTQDRVKELLDYDETTGELTWKKITSNRVKLLTPAPSLNRQGYKRIGIDGARYLQHRIIWLWYYGYFPESILDHRDRDKSNNRIANLREVSMQCNGRNCKLRKDNRSGVKGVYWHPHTRKWIVKMRINKNSKHIGHFDSFMEAVAHRFAVEQCLGWSDCDTTAYAAILMEGL